MKFVSDIIKRRELLLALAKKEVKARYMNAYLGFAWVIIHPLVLMVVLSLIMRTRVKDWELFPIFLLIGLIPWNFFNLTLSESTSSIVNNASLIKKVYFPRMLIPLSTILSNLFHFALSLLVLFAFIFIFGLLFRNPLTLFALFLPVVILIHLIFVTGISLLTSALCVSFRDVKYIVQAALLPWFFMSGIFFNYRDSIPEKYWNFFFLNPMAGVIEMYRDILYHGRIMQPLHFWSALAISLVFLIAGVGVFLKREKLFADFV